jgi:hypothetical protein
VARGTITSVFLIVAAAVAFGACVGDDPDTSPPSGGDGGSSSSGGPAVDNLVVGGGFENGCGEPVFYSNGGPLVSFSEFGRSGAKACKVCRAADSAEPSLYLYARLDLRPNAGEVYSVSAFVRRAPGAETNGDNQISISGIDPGGSVMEDNKTGANGPKIIGDVWAIAEATWTVAQDGADSVRVDFGIPQAAEGNCFLVDDLVVVRKK